MYAASPSWSGWGGFYLFLIVDAAIFIESDVGAILAETVEVWGRARRSLFENDITHRI